MRFATGQRTFVDIDRTGLDQFLVHLVVNANQALADGGTIGISVRRFVHPEHGPVARLVVSDDGVGMSEDVVARIFEPFFTTKGVGEGTGLGLSNVHGIVVQAGGSIEVCSPLGEGTSFTVDLPEVEEPSEE